MKNSESGNELSHCPDCHHHGLNRLADGRCQCKRCRKKFTPRPRKSRLPGSVLREIAGSFWLMAPAARSSGRLGVNRKTIQRYYLILRLRITRNRERTVREEFGRFSLDYAPFDGLCPAGAGKVMHERYPVFAVILREGQAWVVFPEKNGNDGATGEAGKKRVAPDYWIYARGLGAYEKKDIDRFSCMPGPGREGHDGQPSPGNDRQEFWLFAKRRLKKYCGGFKRNFPLFIREMEFRYNHRDDADAVAHLLGLLPRGPE